ncbi:MAG TPA: phospholipase D-like domain-containing protein [Syntrophales bacterium]|nr:phospholipase D-like domain-containing protein [Syntrophales bacterium]
MAKRKYFGKKKRLQRMMHLLRRIHPTDLSVVHRQNQLVFFNGGSQFFQSLYSAIRSAEHFILVECYMIHNDRTGNAFASELKEAARRGVRVLLIYDYIGSIETPLNYFGDMTQQGIEVIPFNVPSLKRSLRWFDRRDHRKMIIIDGRLAFLGSLNVGDEYSGLAKSPHRFYDVGLSVLGSAVIELVSIFSETWLMERGELPRLPISGSDEDSHNIQQGQGNVTIVSGGPHNRRSRIRSAFLFNIVAASEEILIATPYFIPGPRVIRSLLRAAARGVRVRLLLPARSDVPIVRLLGRSYYSVLLRKGIDIYEMEYEILHAKVMLIDGRQTVMGSANIDQRSFHRNFEINFIIDDEDFGRQIQTVLLEDFRNSRRIDLADHERRGTITRTLEKVINLFGWFL